MKQPQELISNIQEMSEGLAKALTGKRKEIFEAVQEGQVKAQ